MDEPTQNQEESPVETSSESSSVPETSNAQILINLEDMIKTSVAQIERDEYEAKRYKEGLDDILLNDETYQAHLKTVNEAKKVLMNTKQQALKHPAAAELNAKYKDLKETIKEKKEGLADYIAEYIRMSGLTSIQIEDDVMDIVQIPKLVKRSGPPKKEK